MIISFKFKWFVRCKEYNIICLGTGNLGLVEMVQPAIIKGRELAGFIIHLHIKTQVCCTT